MYKNTKMLISPDNVLQEKYFEGRIKKLGDNNVRDNNADAT